MMNNILIGVGIVGAITILIQIIIMFATFRGTKKAARIQRELELKIANETQKFILITGISSTLADTLILYKMNISSDPRHIDEFQRKCETAIKDLYLRECLASLGSRSKTPLHSVKSMLFP